MNSPSKNWILLIFLSMLVHTHVHAQNATAVRSAKELCSKIISNKWEKTGSDRYGRRTVQKFVGWAPNGPFPPGKYGSNYFWVFNLTLNKDGDLIEFGVDCVFDKTGKVIGLELRDD